MTRIVPHRSTVVLLLVVLIIGVSGAAVFAVSAHYKKGSPQCSASGTTGTCSGSIAGLGNDNVKITVTVTGTAQPFCAAPGNPGNVVPGQNPVDFTASGSQIISSDQIKNGNLSFMVSATATVPTPTAEEAGCPNPNWNVTISEASVKTITLTVEQPVGTVLADLTRTFTF